jgi:hypothetical protein
LDLNPAKLSHVTENKFIFLCNFERPNDGRLKVKISSLIWISNYHLAFRSCVDGNINKILDTNYYYISENIQNVSVNFQYGIEDNSEAYIMCAYVKLWESVYCNNLQFEENAVGF